MIDLKVILVEDDGTLRDRLTRILSREIKEIKSYSNAADALRDFATYSPDLVITDIKMPNMTGLEMIRIMRESFKNIPVIIASAFNDSNYLLDAIKLKIDNFIVKPIDIDELLKCIQDIDKKLHISKELAEKNTLLNQYQHIVDLSSYITITDKKGVIIYANNKFCDLSGFKCDEVIGKPHNIVRHPDMSKEFFAQMWKKILNKEVWQGVVKNRRKDGTSYYVDTTISPILDVNGEIVEFISIKKDITDMILTKIQLERDIVTDRLTMLPNRLSLQRKLKEENSAIRQMMLIDIDRFKDINMLFGIHFGDAVLLYIAQVLQETRPSEQFGIFRITADEFLVTYESENSQALREHVNTLKSYIQTHPFEFKDISFDIDFTAVIVSCRESCPSLENLQKAMDDTKKKRQSVNVYEQILDSDETYKYNFTWTQKIKEAIHENRVELFFQPLYDMKRQEITKYESLIRIVEKDGMVITPNYFLHVAKLSRSYQDLTKIVITKAFEEAAKTGLRFSINLSIEDLIDEETLAFLIFKAQKHNLQEKIIVEVLESDGIDNIELVSSVFKRLRETGFEIAIDDFGSGYSNFSYLASLSIDILKIDGSLIRNIVNDRSSRIIVQSIIMFANELGIKCVAEFVSNKEIFDVLKELGIDMVQGYYIGAPTKDTNIKFTESQ